MVRAGRVAVLVWDDLAWTRQDKAGREDQCNSGMMGMARSGAHARPSHMARTLDANAKPMQKATAVVAHGWSHGLTLTRGRDLGGLGLAWNLASQTPSLTDGWSVLVSTYPFLFVKYGSTYSLYIVLLINGIK